MSHDSLNRFSTHELFFFPSNQYFLNLIIYFGSVSSGVRRYRVDTSVNVLLLVRGVNFFNVLLCRKYLIVSLMIRPCIGFSTFQPPSIVESILLEYPSKESWTC